MMSVEVGDRVKILRGSWAKLEGIVQEVKSESIRVLVDGTYTVWLGFGDFEVMA